MAANYQFSAGVETKREPKERPILFKAEMVNAILAGTKVQTRRLVKPQPANGCRYEMNGAGTHALHFAGDGHIDIPLVCVPPTGRSQDHRLACPFGGPGDRLWVKETWQLLTGNGHRIVYRADADPPMTCGGREPVQNMTWRPSIFLRRRDSRLTLEITDVRVQRLQAITEEDARAEGVTVTKSCDACGPGIPVDAVRCPTCGDMHKFSGGSARMAFASLWDSINGKTASWKSNPWIWCIGFRRLS